MWKIVSAMLVGVVLSGWSAVASARPAQASGAAPDLVLFTRQSSVLIRTPTGEDVLDLTPIVWGPNWGWTGLQGSFSTEGGAAAGTFAAQLGPQRVPAKFELRVTQRSAREYAISVRFSTERDAELTQAVVAIEGGRLLRGAGRATVRDAEGERAFDVPLGTGPLSEQMQQLVLRDAAGAAFAFSAASPIRAARDGAARIVLATERLAGGEVRSAELVLTLPRDAVFVTSAADAPMPENWAQWFEWQGTGRGGAGDALDVSGWMDAPAGRHGRVLREGDRLMYNGNPVKFWGVNASFASCAPPKDRAERQAAFYARYGINSVRLHKYADGRGWAGILSDGAANFDPAALDRMDYYVAQLKQRGIYTKLSANFGALPLGPADFASLQVARDYRPNNDGWARADQGALWFSPEVQKLQMDQLLKVLEHTNPHTGMKYADDPAIVCVELVNENSIFFYTTMAALQQRPTVRRLAGEAFFAWLKEKYGTERALLAAWGDRAMGSFTGEGLAEESWASGIILPAGNPWFYDPDNLNGSQAFRKQRLLDTMAFKYDQQNKFYDAFVNAIRETGYTGEIIASNWQAGRAFSHYLNLHSDARVGMIDRHNYFGGAGAMVSAPGGGSLSSGMQQVARLPFMLSEWIHTFPNEFGVEGPAIIAAYGMGLNGWDVSYMFQNGDEGTFRRELGQEWDVVAPQIIGLFPAVARQIYRDDIRESDLIFSRNVHVPSLKEGRLGFDDRVEQGYDIKEFGSDSVPAATLAIGRGVVTFTDSFQPTSKVDLSQYVQDGVIRSSTGQLAWTAGQSQRDGHFTISTPGTQAVVGFASGVRAELSNVTITPQTPFAAVYVSAVDRDATIASGNRLLVSTIGRVRNTDQKMVAGTLLSRGTGPMRVEPVKAELTLKRPGPFTVHVLDHDGKRTGRTLPVAGSTVVLDGVATQAVYYEITFP